LIAALSNEQLVAHAANALAAIGPPAVAAVPELVRVLATHEFFEYRCAAGIALGRIGTEQAVAALKSGMNDRRQEVRAAAQAAMKFAKK
jgi:HEAT repeat protein